MSEMQIIHCPSGKYYELGNARVMHTAKPEVFVFEHRTRGDEGFVGNVWVKKDYIMDYDGVYNMPKDVESIMFELGYKWA